MIRRESRLGESVDGAAAQSGGQAVGEHQRSGDCLDLGAIAHHERIEPITRHRGPVATRSKLEKPKPVNSASPSVRKPVSSRGDIEPLRNCPQRAVGDLQARRLERERAAARTGHAEGGELDAIADLDGAFTGAPRANRCFRRAHP